MKFSRLVIKNGIVSFQENIEKDEELDKENDNQKNGNSQSGKEEQESGQEGEPQEDKSVQQGNDQSEESQESQSEQQDGSEQEDNSSKQNTSTQSDDNQQNSDSQSSKEQQESGQEGEPQENKSEQQGNEQSEETQEDQSEQQDSCEQEENSSKQDTSTQNDDNQQNSDSQSSKEQQESGQEGEPQENKSEQQGNEQSEETQEGQSEQQDSSEQEENSSKQDTSTQSDDNQQNTESKNSKEQQKNDPKRAFREMLKYDSSKKNENTSTGGGISLITGDDFDDKEIPDSLINVLIEKSQEGQSEQQDSSEQEENNGDQDTSTQSDNNQQNSDSQSSKEEQENGQEGEPQENKSEQQKNDSKKAFREMLKYDSSKKNENTSTGGGISLITGDDFDDKEIPDSLINVLIEKFLNKTFIAKETDLNARRESLVPTVGDIKWNIPDLIRHRTTKQYNQMLHDKYGYTKENGEDEKIPLSFYFDLSGSMTEYSRELALISLRLLKKKVKVLIGVNEFIEYQINSISDNFSIDDLAKFFKDGNIKNNKRKNQTIDVQKFKDRKVIDEYLREKEAKKVAVFSDFDPKDKVENLSNYSEIYWFCLEDREVYKNTSLEKFKGHFYSMQNMKEFIKHLKNIDNRYYEIMQRRKWEGEER